MAPAEVGDTASGRRQAARWLWCGNIAVAVLIGTAYLAHVPVRASLGTRLFAPVALISTMALLSLAPGLLLQGVASLPWRRLGAAIQAITWTLAQLLVFADTRVHEMFRLHFNGIIWTMLTTPGLEDSVQIGWKTWLQVSIAGALLACVQWFALRALLRGPAMAPDARPRRRLRPGLVVSLSLFLVILTEKSVHAWADVAGRRGITAVSSLFPGYLPFTMRRTLREHGFGGESETRGLPTENSLLAYPLRPIALPPDGPRPNVLMIVVDSLRADMLAPATMPRTCAMAASARRFDDHLSSGNGTRAGVFGLIYGLTGSYWQPMLSERRAPVMLDALEAAGYDLRAFSSATLSSPELSLTCFVGLSRSGAGASPDRIEDSLLHSSEGGHDTLTGRRAAAWIREHRRPAAPGGPARPFFGFVMLDAPHQPYPYPPEHAVFLPAAGEIDYLSFSREPDARTAQLLFNRYRNAVHHADAVVGDILDAVHDAGLDESTLVIITGDHGESFGEHGAWGHARDFTREQIHVPFLLRGPGVVPGIEARPTSHLDVPATILESCGLAAELRPSWTLGGNLHEPPQSRRRVISGWERMAMETPDATIWLPLAGALGGIEALDADWQPLSDADQDRVLAENAEAIAALAHDCRRFVQ